MLRSPVVQLTADARLDRDSDARRIEARAITDRSPDTCRASEVCVALFTFPYGRSARRARNTKLTRGWIRPRLYEPQTLIDTCPIISYVAARLTGFLSSVGIHLSSWFDVPTTFGFAGTDLAAAQSLCDEATG